MLTELPATILVLLPGYVVVRFFLWGSHWREQSSLEIILWSLGAAFLILVPLSGAWNRWWGGPSFVELLSSNGEIPWQMALALYVAAPPLGALLGRADRSGVFGYVLWPLGIDLQRREDVWFFVFSRPRWCRVRTKDGRTYYGWPQHFSRDRRSNATELYLVKAQRLGDDGKFADLDEAIDGIWLDASNIAGIAVTKYGVQESEEMEVATEL